MSERVYDSPIPWVREHIAEYTKTGGKSGHLLQGRPTLLLTTRGRRTGLLRRTGATYVHDGDAFVVTDSAGGAPAAPAWSLNLRADASAEVQVSDRAFAARARFAEGHERDRLWRKLVRMDPTFTFLQTRTSRRFGVIVLEPMEDYRDVSNG